jgi:hypothetical protein
MRLVIGYRYSRYIDLSDKVNTNAVLSPFDYTHIVLEGVAAHPEILANMSIGEGEWILQKTCQNAVAVDKDKIICDAEAGFPHTKFGVAVKKSVGGYLVTSSRFSWSCESVAHASVPGVLIVACFDGRYTNTALASFNGLFYAEATYRCKPVGTSIGYRLTTVTFDDGRSIIVAYPNRIVEVGLPVEAIALTPREEMLVLSKNSVIEVSHDETRPLVVVDSKPIFKGFFFTLPAFQISNTLYALDGGSLVKRLDVRGDATVWSMVVDDASTELAVYNPSLKPDLVVRKEPEARCWATPEGVVCCRGSWCGVVEPGESVIEVEPLNESHGFAAKSDTYVKIHSDLGVQVVRDSARAVDEKASLLRPKRYALSVEHLLGYTDIVLESPPKPVKVEVSKAVIETSSALHECGGLAHGVIDVRVVEKPGRVKVLAGRAGVEKTGSVEVCLSSIGSVPIVAVDPVANDAVKLLEVKPEVHYIPAPRVDLRLKHFESYSEAEIAKDSDTEVLEAKLCCINTCDDIPKRIENCRLPAYIVVKVKKSGFVYSYKFNVSIPSLVNDVVEAVKGFAAKIVRSSLGGFIASGVVPEQPAIPPIYDLQAYVAPRSVTIEFMSRAVGRGVIVEPSGYIEGFILKHGKNSITIPFTDRLFIVIQTNLKWVFSIELKPEQLLLAGKVHADALAKALEKVSKA